MKTDASRHSPSGPNGRSAAQRVIVKGRSMVMLDESEYERLLQKADEWEPAMPAPDADGNYPAVEALRVSLARKILRHRRRVGWTQAELARRARIRVETLRRIEHGTHSPSVGTVAKIDRALHAVEAKSAGH